MTETDGSDPRTRLVAAMNAVVAEKGYTATTIADIVARARVSRRTFYEHFGDKEDCLLACHVLLGEVMLDAINRIDFPDHDTAARIADAVQALLGALTAQPDLTYTHFVAMYSAGPRARKARSDVQAKLAVAIQVIAARAAESDGTVRVPSDLMATAIVGGIGELIVGSVERNRVDNLEEIAPTVVEFVSAILL